MHWNKPITTTQEYEKAIKGLSSIVDANPDSAQKAWRQNSWSH